MGALNGVSYSEVLFADKDRRIKSLRRDLLYTMRQYMPVDTGNLKRNAVYSIITQFGFMIVFDTRFASYLPIVNEGRQNNMSPKMKANVGCVNRALLAGSIQVKRHYKDQQERYDALKYWRERGENFILTKPDYIHERIQPLLIKDQNNFKQIVSDDMEDYYIPRGKARMFQRFKSSIDKARQNGDFEDYATYNNEEKEFVTQEEMYGKL